MPLPTFSGISAGLVSKPFSGDGCETDETLYHAAGLATSIFEEIQEEVVLLFDQLCGGTPGQVSAMGRIIGATSSFNVKMDLVTQATKTFIGDNRKREAVLGWLKLCKKAAEIRNKIAHGKPLAAHYAHDGENRFGVFWAPSLFDTKKIGKSIKEWDYCWNEKQLQAYSMTFRSLRITLTMARGELICEGATPEVLDPDTMQPVRDQKSR